jgi:hypothetical protein
VFWDEMLGRSVFWDAMLSRSVFWDEMLGRSGSVFWCFKGTKISPPSDQGVHEELFRYVYSQ